jgi:hypothetical protein
MTVYYRISIGGPVPGKPGVTTSRTLQDVRLSLIDALEYALSCTDDIDLISVWPYHVTSWGKEQGHGYQHKYRLCGHGIWRGFTDCFNSSYIDKSKCVCEAV